MNKLVAKFAGYVILVFFISVAAFSPGCNKDKECKAVITCLDGNGSPMVGAEVKLRHNSDVKMTGTTDGSGTVNFETDLPMILDIDVNGNITGRVARFEEGQTDNVTVQ